MIDRMEEREDRGDMRPPRAAFGTREPDRPDGTTQEDRSDPALGAAFFGVDERELVDLLHLCGGVATNVGYFDLDNRLRGSWADLYRHHEVTVLAEIVALDSERRWEAFARRVEDGDARRLASDVIEMSKQLDRWMVVLGRSEHRATARLARAMEAMVRAELAPALHSALEFRRSVLAERGEGARADASGRAEAPAGERGLHPAWGVTLDVEGQAGSPLSTLPATPPDRRDHLAWAAHTVMNGKTYLARSGRAVLSELLRCQTNDPALGLVIAFLLLFLRSREELNGFPERRLEFYVRDFLGARPRPRIPDHAHLVLRPAPGFTSVLVPGGTTFSAGRDKEKQELVFAAPGPVLVTDVSVAELRGFHLEADPLISPEREFGFVTRVMGGIAHDPAPRIVEGEPTAAFAGVHRGSPYSTAEASVGFAVASPILALAEGTRRLSFELELGGPMGVPDVPLDQAIEELQQLPPGASREFFEGFGRIFSRGLLGGAGGAEGRSAREWWSPRQKGALRAAARRVLGRDGRGVDVLDEVLDRDPLVHFYELFRAALIVRFTGPDGWEEVGQLHVGPLPAGAGTPGLRIEMALGPDVPAIVAFSPELHGDHHGGRLPIVSFRANPRALFYPFSLLDNLALASIRVEVAVTGVTDLVVQNGLGPVDATKPFQPFGPLPSRDSYLVVGSYETALKTLTAATLHVEWGDLPDLPGGFRQHYVPYGTGVGNDSFRAAVSFLSDGRWEPADPRRGSDVPLFATVREGGKLAREVRIPLRPIELFRPVHEGTSRSDFAHLPRARQGHFRLSLGASEATFGHRDYPRLLTDVLSRNARRRNPEPLPDAPYTPVVTRLSLDYVARTALRPGAEPGARPDRMGERILHEHPFGTEDLTAAADEQVFSLMPSRPMTEDGAGRFRGREGYLFVGLTGAQVSGPLSLLFHLRHDALQDPTARDPEISWFHLASNRWRSLPPSRILGDTTEGFQRSGIVTLDVPGEIDLGNTILPGDRYWLAVGANGPMLSLAHRLLSVSAGALEVVWMDRGNARPRMEDGLPAGTIRGPVSAVPGLGSVLQVGESFGGRPADAPAAVVTRMAERLRHKARASTPWDFERLVLDRFPEVHLVKAFPCTDLRCDGTAPGQVLVVVVPRLVRREDDRTLTPRFSGGELTRMGDFLRDRASVFARVVVANPVYEQIQVRCTVRWTGGMRAGHLLRELNDVLVDVLSPWRPGGLGSRFGWRIRRKDIEGRIRELPFVEFVTRFSMLQITLDDRGLYSLGDTARGQARLPLDEGSAGEEGRPVKGGRRPGHLALGTEELAAIPSTSELEVSARYPWSLAVPTRTHFIESTAQGLEVAATATGFGDLQIGTTFILGSGNRHG